jgi:hypothetical protein
MYTYAPPFRLRKGYVLEIERENRIYSEHHTEIRVTG